MIMLLNKFLGRWIHLHLLPLSLTHIHTLHMHRYKQTWVESTRKKKIMSVLNMWRLLVSIFPQNTMQPLFIWRLHCVRYYHDDSKHTRMMCRPFASTVSYYVRDFSIYNSMEDPGISHGYRRMIAYSSWNLRPDSSQWENGVMSNSGPRRGEWDWQVWSPPKHCSYSFYLRDVGCAPVLFLP